MDVIKLKLRLIKQRIWTQIFLSKVVIKIKSACLAASGIDSYDMQFLIRPDKSSADLYVRLEAAITEYPDLDSATANVLPTAPQPIKAILVDLFKSI